MLTSEWNPAVSVESVSRVQIPNHYSAKLSDLDLEMAMAVAPGGNWKQIPASIASKRLEGIRQSYAAGKGSRSTYYGRLRPDAPSYTINTYFSRPGNGCHLHYDFDGGQHRVISQREAARLQSFPDSFAFAGSRGSVNKQIGNAVPPLLAFQIAQGFARPGRFVDIFSGAGGLSLGFIWAGWKPIVGNDIEPSFLSTYVSNVHEAVVCGDIRNDDVFAEIVKRTEQQVEPDEPLLLLGGPPCQGFSTAGNRRSMNDERNHLFRQYVAMLNAIQPDGFVFENVPGLLSMEKGRVFEFILQEFQSNGWDVSVWLIRAELFGIPQRRKRVIVVGVPQGIVPPTDPLPLTELSVGNMLVPVGSEVPTVKEALDDLPRLQHGEDGSGMNYIMEPTTPYQGLMRGYISPADYLSALRAASHAGESSLVDAL